MQEVLFRFPRRHSCPPAGKSELGGEFLRRRDPAASTSPHLKWLLSSPVTFPPGRLTDCIRSPNHIKDIYKRRQRERSVPASAMYLWSTSGKLTLLAFTLVSQLTGQSGTYCYFHFSSRRPLTSPTQTCTSANVESKFNACFPR